jgi:sugar phosphate isomerase/epimerase
MTMRPTEVSHPALRLLSISHLTVLDASPPELVTAAADAGFDAVGIRVWPAADEPGYPMLGDTPMLRETLLRLADTGTCVLDVEVLRLRPGGRMDDALRILDAGARLQARAVLVICNDPEENRLAERFAAVCEAAGERGLRACLEFMIFSSVKTIADAQRVLKRAGHPAGAILIDALHLQRSAGTPADVSAVAPELLPYAQVCDGPFQPILPDSAVALAEARTGRLFPCDGELPLAELLGALPAGAALAVEAPVADLAGRTIGERTRLAHAALTAMLAKGETGLAIRPTGGARTRTPD